jgi:hypothetical protein
VGHVVTAMTGLECVVDECRGWASFARRRRRRRRRSEDDDGIIYHVLVARRVRVRGCVAPTPRRHHDTAVS